MGDLLRHPSCDWLAPEIGDTPLGLGVKERPPSWAHRSRVGGETSRCFVGGPPSNAMIATPCGGICRRIFVGVSDRLPVRRDSWIMCFCIVKPNGIAAFHWNFPNSLLRAPLAVNHPLTVRRTVRHAVILKRAVGQLLGVVAALSILQIW